ncbi:hypothetical protein [Micromonospora echinofusca]|uniref:Uncharacterized protein n=1 Tax=Micromonospora echinofusca TaxID=47858 RepID=A0ABS3VX24_MICEH|nr:hypothetical protein [Micromonospora echinofusca]MBO4209021.1 hypothetical protein [Micromonospora echinofusca]
MGKHVDEVNKWVNAFDDSLAALHKKYGDPLRFESSGDGAAESSPGNADNAAEVLKKVRTGLEELSAALLTEDLDRQGYWQGPAADVFGDTIKVYRGYFAELASMIKLYEVATKDKVAKQHRAALEAFENALNGEGGLRKKWKAVEERHYDRVVFLAGLVDMRENRWNWRWGVIEPVSADVIDAYNEATRQYRAEAEAVYQESATRFAKIWTDLNPVYQSAVVDYKPLPSPDFSTVRARGVDSDKPPAGPDDGAPPPDLPGPDLPGLGGMPDPSGTMPDLGGGGLGDLGAGAGLGGAGLGGAGLGDLGAGGLPDLGAGGLLPGPDGTSGIDVTGNGVPDVNPGGIPLPGGDLPAGSRVVRRPDGSKGIDLNGDGVADVDMDGRAVPEGGAPQESRLVTGPDGRTGYDTNGDGVPDVGFDGRPMSSDPAGSPDPVGRVPGDQVRQVSGGDGATPTISTAAVGGPLGTGYPPPIPPAVGAGAGGTNNERERQTWLQEDEQVWADDHAPISALGRPSDDEDDEDVPDEWAAPPRRPRGAPQRATQGSWPPGRSRG